MFAGKKQWKLAVDTVERNTPAFKAFAQQVVQLIGDGKFGGAEVDGQPGPGEFGFRLFGRRYVVVHEAVPMAGDNDPMRQLAFGYSSINLYHVTHTGERQSVGGKLEIHSDGRLIRGCVGTPDAEEIYVVDTNAAYGRVSVPRVSDLQPEQVRDLMLQVLAEWKA